MSVDDPAPTPEAPGDEAPLTVAGRLSGYLRGGGIVTPLLTALLAFLVGGLVVLATGKDPIATYRAIWNGTGLNWPFLWISGQDTTIAAQPTRGLDVGAIEFVHRRLVEERDQGIAVLLVSLEMEEIRSLSDRVLVIYEGEIVAEMPPSASEEDFGLAMTGGGRKAEG